VGLGSALGEKGKKSAWVKKKKKSACEESREVVWGGKRVAEPGDMPLMTPIRPPAINLSLKFQHFSSSAYYVGFVKKYLNSS